MQFPCNGSHPSGSGSKYFFFFFFTPNAATNAESKNTLFCFKQGRRVRALPLQALLPSTHLGRHPSCSRQAASCTGNVQHRRLRDDQGKAIITHLIRGGLVCLSRGLCCMSARGELPPTGDPPRQQGTVLGCLHNCPCIFGAQGLAQRLKYHAYQLGPCEQKIAEDLVAVSFQDIQE